MGSELNIYKIAQEAGVSPATVSRVMTKNARVSEEKRARVEAVIRKYDYRPNALAQGLIKTKTNVIGVLAADLVNPYYSSMLVFPMTIISLAFALATAVASKIGS